MTLEGAIQQQIEIGERDPIIIADKIVDLYGRDWMCEQLCEQAEHLVAGIARSRIGSQRRVTQLNLKPGNPVPQAELKIRSFWVPGKGYVRAADLTSDNLESRAAWNDRFIATVDRHSSWCRQVAAMIRSEGAKNLGRLKAELPALPPVDIGILS